MKQKTIILISFILISLASPIQASPDEVQLETVARGFIKSLNSQDTVQREQFLKDHYINADSATARERWQGHLNRFSHILGQVEIHDIDVSNPSKLDVLIKSANPRSLNQWTIFSVIMDIENPKKFRSMSQTPGMDPNIILPDRPLTTIEISQHIEAFVDDMVSRDVFSGSVSLVKDGKPFFTGVYGKADLRWGIDNKLDTKFNLGSMNKMFTGVAICQLVSQGKLAFDDPVGKYLPDYPNQEVKDKVTVHHLLTHTSGMGSYWDAMANMDWTKLRSVKDFAELSMYDSLAFEPGERFYYSNSGPLVLGLIIEKLTGMDYHDYIRKNVTGPAGMRNTDCYHVDDVVPNLAQGYFWNDETNTFRANIFEHSVRGSAAGGGFSTVEDLQKFAEALYNGILLTPEMLEIYTTGKVPHGPEDSYAYLISDSRWEGHRAVGHGGGAPGINADLKIFPDLGFTIATMSNYDEAANAITTYATRLIIHKRPVQK